MSMMVNFNSLMTTTPNNAKGSATATDSAAPASGFAALFAALSQHAQSQTGTFENPLAPATTEAELQQLAANLKASEQEKLLEQADLSPEAIAQILAQLQQQQAAQQPQLEQPAAANLTAQAGVANREQMTQSVCQTAASVQLSQTVSDEKTSASAAAEVKDRLVTTKPVEQVVVSTSAVPQDQQKANTRNETAPLTTELKSLNQSGQFDTVRATQAPVSSVNASVIMIEAPVAQSAPTTPSTTAATASLAAPVGSQAWANQLQQNVLQMVMHNQNEMTLRLHPAELGPLQVQLRMDDTTAQLNILTHSQQVRGALEQAMPTLREALANQGIQLGDSQVNDQGQQFAQQQARQQAQQWSANSQQNEQNTGENTVENSESAENTDMGVNSRHTAGAQNGQVDTFA